MAPLLIFPCNGNAMEAIDCLGDAYSLIGFVDDSADKVGTECLGYSVLSRAALQQHPEARVLAVPGSPASYHTRQSVIAKLGVQPERFARVIHPSACVSASAQLGHNVLIMAQAVITSNAIIGDHVCVLPNSIVHHDSRIGDWTLVGSSVTIAGGVVVGRNCYIGSGSTVMNGVKIGDGALVGLASNVIRDVPSQRVVVGNPARDLRRANI